MFRKTTIVVLSLICFFSTLKTQASEPNDYIIPGRSYMFDETLSGMRLAYETFDNGINDQNCPDCNSNRELIFLHAVTRTAMLAARDDGGQIDGLLELAREFGIEVFGNYWDELDANYPVNQHDAYEIPEGAPDANEISDIIGTWMIPEINEIIDDLNSISDSPEDRFRIFFHPDETGLENDLEVDYGEVLILKGLLTALKGQLQTQAAYDMYVDANDMLVEKAYGNCFNANRDLLDPHPDLFKVLPTANDSNDGAAVLAQARQDLIDAINYYFDAIDYIRAEEDPQEDDLLYIDPNNESLANEVNDILVTLQDSLTDDAVGIYPWETAKEYNIQDPCSTTDWILTLNYALLGFPAEKPGSFVASDSNSAPSPWKVKDISVDGNEIILEMDYDVPGYWGSALFIATLSDDGNNITNGTFDYWGESSGTIYNLYGQIVATEVVEKQMDLNPVFGSSARYPDPVNPRDVLPEFDSWNYPLPGTIAKGLGYDGTLGGIMPDMNQYNWQVLCDLQPSGLFYLDFISPLQVIVDGNANDWTEGQLVFDDISGDTENDSNIVQGVDIEKLYMAYDVGNVYGAVTFYDIVSDPNQPRSYTLSLNYSPYNTSVFDALRFEVYFSESFTYGYLYHMTYDEWGGVSWQEVADLDFAVGQNAVEFKIPYAEIPSNLAGRFIALESRGWDPSWYKRDGEKNLTHLRIGEVGSISGTVTYNGYREAPIFVQAYTDPAHPEDSVVASTMIHEPGLYTLEGVGLDWSGYVRAFTPLFGFDNPFELCAFDIQACVPIFLMYAHIDGVDIVLNNPPILKKDILESGEIDADSYEVDWYAFDAVEGGTYTLDLTQGTSNYACMTLYGRDGHTVLRKMYYWETQHIEWLCPVSGKYYVKVANGYYEPDGGTYQIQMTSDLTCPQTDIACAEWVGVKDCKVDIYDLAVLMSNWLGNCSDPYWCEDSDFDESGSADFADFAAIANEWLVDGML